MAAPYFMSGYLEIFFNLMGRLKNGPLCGCCVSYLNTFGRNDKNKKSFSDTYKCIRNGCFKQEI